MNLQIVINALTARRDTLDRAIASLQAVIDAPEPSPEPAMAAAKPGAATPKAEAPKAARAARVGRGAMRGGTSTTSQGGTVAARIMAYVQAHPEPLKGPEVAAALGLTRETTRKQLAALREAGAVVLTGHAHNARWSRAPSPGPGSVAKSPASASAPAEKAPTRKTVRAAGGEFDVVFDGRGSLHNMGQATS